MLSELLLDVAFDSYRIDTKKRSGVRGTLFLLSGSQDPLDACDLESRELTQHCRMLNEDDL